MKKIWAGVYLITPQGKRDWIKDSSGVRWRVAIGWKEMLKWLFASDPAKQLNLKRCVELGQHASLEVPEAQWPAFRVELVALAELAGRMKVVGNIKDENGREIDLINGTAFDEVVAKTLEALDHVEQYKGKNPVFSIAAD